MEEIDTLSTLSLLFDYQYFTKIDGSHSSSWLSGFEYYENVYLPECMAPNKEFVADEKLLYTISATGEKECKLSKWKQPINEDSLNLIRSYYLSSQDKETVLYRQDLIKDNLKEVVQYYPSNVEKLLGTKIVNLKSEVLNALSGKPDYLLKEESIKYLENEILVGKGFNFVRPAAKILANCVMYHQIGNEHGDFLVNLLKNESLPADIKDNCFKQFAKNIQGIKHWDNNRFDAFASLLPYDGSEHFLAKGLINAHKIHGYVPSMEVFPLFEKLIAEGTLKDVNGDFISKSLEHFIYTNGQAGLGKIEERVVYLFDQAGKLPPNLVKAIFDFYKHDQTHFNGLIVSLIAEDKLLSGELMRKLVEPLIKIEDARTALFIAMRLTQYNIDLPPETLNHFIKYINDEDDHISLLASKFYYQKRTQISGEIDENLAEALLTLLPKSSELEYAKINDILNEIKLNEAQNLKRELENQVFEWYLAGSLGAKAFISKELYNKINDKTAEELTLFFKEHLLSQNIDLMRIAKIAFEKISSYRAIVWSEKEQDLLALLEAVEENSTLKLEINQGVEFLLTSLQWDRVKDTFSEFKGYIKQIDFSDIRELEALFKFIKDNQLSPEKFSYGLGSDEDLDVKTFYKNLLKAWVDNIENETELKLTRSSKNALRTSVTYLVDKMGWPADFLFILVKNTQEGGFAKLLSALERLADYKVSPEAIDREGLTAFEILKNFSGEELSKSLSRLINDNHFYINKDIGTLLDEIKQANQGKDKLQGLIENNYFVEQLLKIGYTSEVTSVRPSTYEPNKIYLYKEGSEVYLATSTVIKQLVSLSDSEDAELNKLLENPNHLVKETEDYIFKKAAELGLIVDARNIKPSFKVNDKPLSEWKTNDFIEWRKTITKVDDNNIAEILAVIGQAAYNTYLKQAYPRPIQLISALSLWKSKEGGLVQIATGEGKSLIVATLAILKVLEDKQVDIVTSSSVLAKRDVEDMQEFYSQFRISASHNTGNSDDGVGKACYRGDIVYGDLLNFIGDSMTDLREDKKFGRGFETVIVDEVDSMFIDQNNMKVQLSNSILGINALQAIYAYMRAQAIVLGSQLIQGEEECYFEVHLTDEQKELLKNESLENDFAQIKRYLLGSNCNEYIKSAITNYTRDELFAFQKDRDNRTVFVPSHLKEFVKDQLSKWTDNVMASFHLVEKEEYIVYKNPDPNPRYPFKIIAPIDVRHTGVIQLGLQWADGLHQFLQIKHGVIIFPETVTSIFMSYFGFFNKYEGNIYGVTGTLGQEKHHEFLKEVYGVELNIMPTFVEKDLTEFTPIVLDDEEEWQGEIVDILKRKVEGSRAALVIFEKIAEVENFKTYLESAGYDKTKIFVYGTGDSKEYEVEKKRELQPGDILIATNMAGRGTDLKISPEVKKNGGLHVMMTKLPASVRVKDQGDGRSARQGEPGSAQLIIHMGQMPNTHCNRDIDCLIKECDEKEYQKLEEDRICSLPILTIRDKAFEAYVELIKEIDSPTNYKLILGNSDQLEAKSLYLYAEGTEIILKIVPGKNAQKQNSEIIDITELLNTIDPRATKHIRTVLSDSRGSSSSLNKQDYEIIHFIATLKGYTDYPDIYIRVKAEFHAVVYKESTSTDESSDIKARGYLSTLLREDQFKDLQVGDISDALLKKVEMRKHYFLWVADRQTYNNKYEIEQVTEYWGMFLKKHDDLFKQPKDCIIRNEGQIKASFEKVFERFKEEFEGFKDKISQKKEVGKLIENPSYLVLKALQYLGILGQQSETNSKMEAAGLSGGYSDYVFTFVLNAWNTVSEYISGAKRVSFGGENYNPTNPGETARELAKNATKLDDKYTWTAYNALSLIELLLDGADITEQKQGEDASKVKEAFYNHLMKAIENIEAVYIPALEGQLLVSFAHRLIDETDEQAIQLIGTSEVYKVIVNHFKEQIDKVVKASPKEMIEVGEAISLKQATEVINITAAVLAVMNKTGELSSSAKLSMKNMTKDLEFLCKEFVVNQILREGGYLFSISTYELHKEEKDWGITILAGVVAAVTICVGLWMISAYALSTFAVTLGTSLVIQGIGEIIQSAISFGTGHPLEFESYIKAKGTALAIAVITAGVVHFVNTLPMIQNLGFIQAGVDRTVDAASSPWKFVAGTALLQGTTAGLKIGLDYALKPVVDGEAIENKAGKTVQSIVETYREQLNRIYATDEIYGNEDLQKSVYKQFKEQVMKHAKKFRDELTQMEVGVATNVASTAATVLGFPSIGSIIQGGTQITMGAIKNAQADSKAAAALKEAITQVYARAMSSAELMKHDLNKDFSNDDDGNQLYAELVTQGYVVNNEINYRACGDLNGIQLIELLVGYKEALVGKCNKIGELFTRFRDYSDLQNSYSVMVRELKTSIQENELLGGMTGVVAGEVAQKVVPPMMKKVGEFFKKTQQERQSEHYEEAGDNSKEKAKSKKGRTKVDQNKIAQQTGLDRKPATGKNPEPQPEEGTQGSNGNPGMAEARGETRTARENNLFATRDATGKAAGSRDGFTAMDIPENMELIAHQRIVRLDGKEYLILAQSKRTFSNEGIPLAEDTYFESFEIKGTEQIRDGILLGNTLGSTDPFGKILRESLHISHDLINNVQNIEHRNFMGEGVGSLLNPEMGIWVGKLDMKTPVNQEVVYIKRPQFPALPDKASQNVPPQNKLPQNELSSEVSQGQEKLIGQVLSSEKKEVRSSWEEVAKDMYGFGTGFVKAPVEMARESKEVALTVFKYANKPMEEKVLQVVGGLVKIYQFNKEHNFEEKKQLAKEIGRELLKDVVETVTEPEKQGRFTAEVTLGLGVPRVLKGIKIVGKVVDETTDVTALSKRDLGVGLKEVEVLDKPGFKPQVDAEDWGKGAATKLEGELVKAGTEAGGGFKHCIDIDINLLKREITFSDDLNDPKLRVKFDKHGKHFGVEGMNFNKQNVEIFKQNMRNHISDPDTFVIAGKYTTGGIGDVVHYYNPKTELNVMKDMYGNYVSGWKLSEPQQRHLRQTGKIGGQK